VVYPDLSMSMWVDGRKVMSVGHNGRSKPPPVNPYTQPMSLILSYGVRREGKPTFHERSLHVHSIAVYQDGHHAGQQYTGGGVAPGTTIRHSSSVAHAAESVADSVSSGAGSSSGMPGWEAALIVVVVAVTGFVFLAIVAAVVVIRMRRRAQTADSSKTVPLMLDA